MNIEEVRDALTALERRLTDTDGGFLTDVEVGRETLRKVLLYVRGTLGNAISPYDPDASYKVGEKVLIGDDILNNAPDYLGQVGTLVHISSDGDYRYNVEFADGEPYTCWRIEELRKVEP